MYWTCEILGSFEKLFFLRMTHTHCCRTFMAMCAPRVIPTSLPAWHVLKEICVSERVWSSASPGGGWDRTHQKVHAIASRGHGLSAWVWRGKWLNYEILKMSVAIFFCLPLNMFSIFFCVLFRWIHNGKEGADRDKLNVVVGTDRRGPQLMGGKHILVRKQRHQQNIPFLPGVCRRGQYRACKEVPTDQFVVWKSLSEMNSWCASKIHVKNWWKEMFQSDKGIQKESWWMCIFLTSISKPPLATPWLDRV